MLIFISFFFLFFLCLKAFGNAKTSHNNNSSRFGKFIQVKYRENGQVHGYVHSRRSQWQVINTRVLFLIISTFRALVQKYLLEKSRICFQAKNERNYHVFYHLLVGSSPEDKQAMHLQPPQTYRYLNQVSNLTCIFIEFKKWK